MNKKILLSCLILVLAIPVYAEIFVIDSATKQILSCGINYAEPGQEVVQYNKVTPQKIDHTINICDYRYVDKNTIQLYTKGNLYTKEKLIRKNIQEILRAIAIQAIKDSGNWLPEWDIK